jgi:LysR family glycine cleavage system transcriptional activator
MDRRLIPLNSLRAFEATGLHLSFTRAAERLGVTQSAVSRHVINLETLLGVPLFERRRNGLALTEQGRALLPVVTRGFDEIQRKLEEITGARAEVTLRVALPPTFAYQLAVPLLNEFKKGFPEVSLDLESMGRVVDLESSGCDLAVVYSEPRITDLVMDLLWIERVTPLCHPALLRPGDLEDPGAFVRRNQLLHVKAEGRRYHSWERWLQQAGIAEVNARRGLVFDTGQLAVQYALNGDGVVVTDKSLFRAEIEAGRLVAPFETTVPTGYCYFLMVRAEDLQNAPIQVFRSWLIEHFSAAERAGSDSSALKPQGRGGAAR